MFISTVQRASGEATNFLISVQRGFWKEEDPPTETSFFQVEPFQPFTENWLCSSFGKYSFALLAVKDVNDQKT